MPIHFFACLICRWGFLTLLNISTLFFAFANDVSKFINLYQRLSMFKPQRYNKWVHIDWVIASFNAWGFTIAQSHKGIKLGDLGLMITWTYCQKCSKNVLINEEVNEPFLGVNVCLEESVCPSQIIPIDPLDLSIDSLDSISYISFS